MFLLLCCIIQGLKISRFENFIFSSYITPILLFKLHHKKKFNNPGSHCPIR